MKHTKLFEQFINESKGKDLIRIQKLDWVDHTRLIKFVSKEFGKLDITATRTGGYTIDPSGLSGAEVEILLDYLRSQKYIIEQKIDGSVDFVNEKSDFPVYHNLYSSAINAVEAYANSKGYQLDAEEYGNAYVDAFFKPNEGRTKKDTLTLYKNGKEQRKALHVQIYNRGADKFELNMYIN